MHSIVAPVFNEEEMIEALYQRFSSTLTLLSGDWEVILVNDGSRDGTYEKLKGVCARDKRFKCLNLSRNFGHQAAITAGMEWATGDTVTTIDGDLQDPPEVIAEFFQKWKEGYQLVYGVRSKRDGESKFKLWTAAGFYRVLRAISQVNIPVDSGDFRLMDRKVVDALMSLPEKTRFIRGLSMWVGFKSIPVFYHRAARSAGVTKFSVSKMLQFAFDGVVAFSNFPLRLPVYGGWLLAALTVLLFAFGCILSADRVSQIGSYIAAVVCGVGSLNLFALGLIAEYMGRVHTEVRARPLYLIEESLNFAPNSGPRN